MGAISMGDDEKIREAQDVLDWVTAHLSLGITCKVTGYKHEYYRVQVFKGDTLIMPTQIAEALIKESKPKENIIPDRLKTLLTNIVNY